MLDSCCSIIILFLFSKIILFLEKTFYSGREGGNMLLFLVHSWFILGKKDTLGHNLTLTTFNRQQTKLLILTNPRLYTLIKADLFYFNTIPATISTFVPKEHKTQSTWKKSDRIKNLTRQQEQLYSKKNKLQEEYHKTRRIIFKKNN